MTLARDDVDLIVGTLAAEIADLAPGDRAPSEAEIMGRFSIPRSRARQVVATLEANDLVRRRQGAGTFVRRPYDYLVSDAAPVSLHQTIGRLGGEVRTIAVDVSRVVAPSDVATGLGVSAGTTVARLSRLGYVDDTAAVYLREYVAPGVLDEVRVALQVIESMEELLGVAGYRPYRAQCLGTVDIPDAEVLHRLSLPAASRTWRVTSQVRDRHTGAPLLVSDNHSRMDTIRMVFHMNAGGSDR